MASPVPRLVITDSSGRRQVAVEKALLTIGRRTESDVHVTAVGVSRHHAEIATEGGTSRLRDLDSKFGTFVNGTRTKEHVLEHGDRIRLGNSTDLEIVFVIGDEEPSRDRSAISAAVELRNIRPAFVHA